MAAGLRLPPEGGKRGHKGIAISPDSKLLAFRSGEKTVKLWSLPAGKPVATLEGPKWLTAPVTFSTDGKFLVSGYLGGLVLLWEIGAGKRCWALCDPKVPAR